jgi:fatty acid-binding protein DegV
VPLSTDGAGRSYLADAALSRPVFYSRLLDRGPSRATAVPTPKVIPNAYERLAGMGAFETLSVHISMSLSAFATMQHPAVWETPTPATAFDSGTLSLGTRFLAWAAAEAAAQGQPVEEVTSLVEDQSHHPRVFAALGAPA